jgi:uridine kinase
VKPFIIAIAGASGAGKSTLAAHLARALSPHAALLSEDHYYQCRTAFADFDETTHDFDCIAAKDFALLAQHLSALRAGQSVAVPTYDFTDHRRLPQTHAFAPQSFIIVEGILSLAQADVRAQVDLGVWLEASASVRLDRRIARDVIDRGRTEASVRAQMAATVEPAFARYAPAQRKAADLAISADDLAFDLDAMIAPILARLPPQNRL